MEWMQSAALLIFFSDRLLLNDTVFFPSRLDRDPSWGGDDDKEGRQWRTKRKEGHRGGREGGREKGRLVKSGT